MAAATDGVLALQGRVVAAHQALQLGKLADHFGDEIGLGEPRGALRQFRIGADHRREFARQRRDALDALVLRAKLLVKDDALQLLQPRLRAAPSGRSPKKTSRRTAARARRARCRRRWSRRRRCARMLAVRMNCSRARRCASRSTKHFWLARIVARITSAGCRGSVRRTSPSAPPAIRRGRRLLPAAFVLDELSPCAKARSFPLRVRV